ncbi:hypothetical protein PG987_001758 [Apiospora arundinis]
MSYFRFRQVNRGARLLATGLTKEYLAVATHGLEGLRGLLRGNLDHRFTIPDLYRTLVTRDCALCGDFWGLPVSPVQHPLLLSLHPRVCGPSPSRHHQLLQVRQSDAERGGTAYTGGRNTHRTRPLLHRGHASQENPVSRFCPRWPGCLGISWRSPSCVAETPIHDSDGTPIEQRRMACTTLPWYDPDTSQAEGGVCCKGCLSRNNSRSLEWSASVCKNRMFSSEGFLAHFEECWYAKHLWAHTSGHCGLVYTCNSKLCTTHSKFHI